MGALLDTFDAEEVMAERVEDLTGRGKAMVALGLVDYHFDAYEVQQLGFGRGTFIVTADGDCSCGEPAPCLHRVAVALFVKEPAKPTPTPARREEDPQGPNVAQSMRELVSPRQLRAIRIKCASRGLSAEAESLRLFGARPERLNRKSASKMIDYLEGKN